MEVRHHAVKLAVEQRRGAAKHLLPQRVLFRRRRLFHVKTDHHAALERTALLRAQKERTAHLLGKERQRGPARAILRLDIVAV